ncbi:MAG: 6,7-dimethyl-8-ribityllumazine synthase [Thermoanaerobaculia bacterium]|nr:6,7-dimethyl-8-ribityllumazine synthase [Thermoanaerobaculia bacterium]
MKRSDADRARDEALGIRSQPGDLKGQRFGIVAARFHHSIVDKLLAGATTCLRGHGVVDDDIMILRVPGAWEIPLALDELIEAHVSDALVALGVVIRGETPHFDYVCSEAARGCQDVSLRHRIPVGFGLLTTDDEAQAQARAGGSAGNKGAEAAAAAVEMLLLQQQIRAGRTVVR